MGEEDVWASGGGPRGTEPVDSALGTVAYGEGVWINQSFSLEFVFRYGFALLREQPLLLLTCAGVIWLALTLPQMLTVPGDIFKAVLEASGDPAALWVDFANSLLGLFLAMVAWPFQVLFTTGAISAIGHYVRDDDVDYWRIAGSLRPFGRNVLHRLVVSLINSVVIIAALVPAIGLVGLAVWLELGVFVIAATASVSLLLAGIIVSYVFLPLALGQLAVVLDDKGPLEAVVVAWEAGDGARFTLFGFGLVYALLYAVGCCVVFLVGAIPVMAVFMGGGVVGWLLYARQDDDIRSWPFFRRNPLPW